MLLALAGCQEADRAKHPKDFQLLEFLHSDATAWIVLESDSLARGQAVLDTLLRHWKQHPTLRFYLVDRSRYPYAWEKLGGADTTFPIRLLRHGEPTAQVRSPADLKLLANP